MSQSELVTNTWSQRKARENVCEQVMIVWGLLNFWLVYNGRVFCSRLHGVLSVSIVYPPDWRIMVHFLLPLVHTLYSMACLSSAEHYTALAPWISNLSLRCQYVVSYVAVFVTSINAPTHRRGRGVMSSPDLLLTKPTSLLSDLGKEERIVAWRHNSCVGD